jgi:hypothetical protein
MPPLRNSRYKTALSQPWTVAIVGTVHYRRAVLGLQQLLLEAFTSAAAHVADRHRARGQSHSQIRAELVAIVMKHCNV